MSHSFSGQTKKILDTLLSSLKSKAGLYLLLWLIICLAGVGAVFYLYELNSPAGEQQNIFIKIDKNLYQEVTARLKARETNIQRGIEANYPDPFK